LRPKWGVTVRTRILGEDERMLQRVKG